MAVKDFMTTKVVYVSPDTTVAHAADLMREKNLRRLPVIENDRLVGLLTESAMAAATPSKATSLSIYEMNYLLNKTKIRDIMVKDVITVAPYASLEDAIYIMMTNNIAVLPVAEDGVLSGIITDKDIFRTFLEISGYGEEGVRVRLIVANTVGVLETVVSIISAEGHNIRRLVIANRTADKVVMEIQIDGDFETAYLHHKLTEASLQVVSIDKTHAKSK